MAPSKALSQYTAQREELLDVYFEDTRLLQVLQAFLAKLASDFKTRRVLPLNPYPHLLQLIHQSEIERSLTLKGIFPTTSAASGAQLEFLMHEQQQQQLKTSNTGTNSAPSNRFCLCTTKELLVRSLWGFLPVMERLDLSQLGHRVDAIREIHPSWFAAKDDGGIMSEQDDEGYVVTVFGALVGRGNGFALLAEYPKIEIEQHVVVAGELLEKAMAVFARRLFRFLHELLVGVNNSSKSVSGSSEPNVAIPSGTIGCSGIYIMTVSGPEEGSLSGFDAPQQQQQQIWTIERVNGNRNAFVSAVKLAIVNNASFAITSFSEVVGTPNSTTNSSSISICQTVQRFFFHFVSENRTNKSVKAPAQQRQQPNRSFLTGTRVLESGVFVSARGALEITTRVQNAMASITGTTNSSEKSTPPKAQTGKKSSEIRPSEPNSTQNQRNSSKSLYHVTRASLLIESVFESLQRHTSVSPEVFRQWVKCFASSIGSASLRIALRNQVLIDLLESLGCAIDKSNSWELLEAHFAATSSQMDALLEQARVGSSSSLLRPVGAFLGTLWSEARDKFEFLISSTSNSDDTEGCDFALHIEQLQRANELLLVVARVAVRDFTKLVQSRYHSEAGSIEIGSDNNPTVVDSEEREIDVLRALQGAVEEREYPPLITFECVFAQFLVDSCVDVAFESAVMNIVAFHLPPNPFVELSLKLRVFAVRHHVWAGPLEQPETGGSVQSNRRVSALVDDSEVVVLKLESSNPSRNLYGFNNRILEILDPERMWEAHSWLQSHHIFRQQDFQPSKGSYSVQTFHSLLVFHPLVGYSKRTNQPISTGDNPVSSSIIQGLEVLEHVVVEGKDFAQALAFFAKAVTQDLGRLAGLHQSPHRQNLLANPMEANLIGPLGQIVSDVDNLSNDDDAVMYQLLLEATRAKCSLQLGITFFTEPQSSEIGGGGDNSAIIHIVRKSYVFHHKPTGNGSGDTQQQSNCVSQLLAFRIQQFGVFFNSENAMFVLGECVNRTLSANNEGVMTRELWTPFARQAIANDDLLLKYELDFGAPSDAAAVDFVTPYHHTANHKSGLLLQRLTAHSSILQLYSIHLQQQRLRGPQQSRVRLPVSTPPSQLPLKILILIFETLIHQVENTLLPLNTHMRYVEGLQELLAAFHQTLSILKLSAPSSSAPASQTVMMQTSNSVESMDSMLLLEAVKTLRQTWLLVLYARFSYQQDFFANY